MSNFNVHRSLVRKINSNDSDFQIIDGVTVASRAAIEITASCPREYQMILTQCIAQGWVKPVAYIRDPELMWDKLST